MFQTWLSGAKSPDNYMLNLKHHFVFFLFTILKILLDIFQNRSKRSFMTLVSVLMILIELKNTFVL